MKWKIVVYFNSHPHEEDDVSPQEIFKRIVYFNSHPHEEDDNLFILLQNSGGISTHILTRRMTIIYSRNFLCSLISTHILTRRMTIIPGDVVEAAVFQLTSSRGGWRIDAMKKEIAELFQLTSSRGGWLKRIDLIVARYEFQLTSSRGGWPYLEHSNIVLSIFQLTSSRGGWLKYKMT